MFAGLLISSFVLTVKLLQPVSVQVIIGEGTVELTQQPSFYVLVDVLMIAASAFIGGVCVVCLALGVGESEDDRKREEIDLTSVVDSVDDDSEKVVLGLLAESGGSMFQSDIVNMSGFSKGKVSLVLDRLEARGIVQRNRSGMTNLITIIKNN